MRIKVNFTKNNISVPINNQHLLNSYIHKCLGKNNEYHDAKNDYSISALMGGKLNIDTQTLEFENGGYLVISSHNETFISKILMGIFTNPIFGFGMKFQGVDYLEEKFYDGWNHFTTLSPFLIKEYEDKKKYTFLTLDNENFNPKVKDYLINKISKINPELNLEDFDVQINQHPKHKVKKVMVKNVLNKANQCQISIHTNKQVAELLYNIGIGQSTGSGFGTIYKTENHKVYR